MNISNNILSNNPEEAYERMEERLLDTRKRQLAIQGGFSGYMDLSSATDMHLLPYLEIDLESEIIGKKVVELLRKYPSLHTTDTSFEQKVSKMLEKHTGKIFSTKEISQFGGGVYGSYQSILCALGRKSVIIPKLLHQTHKYCISIVVEEIIEVELTAEYLIDLKDLQKKLHSLSKGSTIVYINHNRGPAISQEYIRILGEIIEEHDALCIYDADVIYTDHDNITKPYAPLVDSVFMNRSIVLINLTKEHGVPGIRIGIGISNHEMTKTIKHHQKSSLHMISPISLSLAMDIIEYTNLDTIRDVLKKRMIHMIVQWEKLGWKDVRKPSIGINLFIDIPPVFQQQYEVPGDELFYFYILSCTGVLLRPSSIYGKDVTYQVRPTISQPESVVEQAFKKMKAAGIAYDMRLPTGIIQAYKSFLGPL